MEENFDLQPGDEVELSEDGKRILLPTQFATAGVVSLKWLGYGDVPVVRDGLRCATLYAPGLWRKGVSGKPTPETAQEADENKE